MVLRDANHLGASNIDGFFTIAGGAGHTSGWISALPADWQAPLGATHITGQSSGIPIISRTSVGPSAFGFDPTKLAHGADTQNPIPSVKLLDFTLGDPLHGDLDNSEGGNDLWTHLSRVVYGFVVPGSRSYVTVGHSGGTPKRRLLQVHAKQRQPVRRLLRAGRE